MTTSPTARLMAIVLLAGVALAGCTGEPVERPCPQTSAGGQPIIGTLLPLSGRLSSIGPDMKRAVDLAAQDVNLAGGVLGRQVEVLHKDTAGTADVARGAADDLVDQGATAVVGPVSSTVALAVVNQTERPGTLVVTPGATTDRLSSQDDADRVFRVPPSDGLQGLALAELLDQQGAGSVAVLHVTTSYGEAILRWLQPALETSETAHVAAVAPIRPGQDHHTDAIDAAKAASPDTVVYIGFPDPGASLLSQAHEEGLLEGREVVFTEGSMSQGFVEAVRNRTGQPGLLTGSQGTAPTAFLAQGADRAFRERFSEAYGHAPGLFAAEAYDATVATLLGMAAAQSDQPADVSACLRAIWDPPGMTVGPERLEEALPAAATGEPIDYETVSGSEAWNETGDPARATFAFWEISQTGAIQVVEPEVRISATS